MRVLLLLIVGSLIVGALAFKQRKSAPYFGDSITSVIEFLALNGTSTGNYLFQYSKSQNIGSFQQNGNMNNAGPNTVYVQIRNYTSGVSNSILITENGSCLTNQNIFGDWTSDITGQLNLLPPEATFIGHSQIGAYMCEGWQFGWVAGGGETVTTWVSEDLKGNPIPVRTDFPSFDQDSNAYYSFYSGVRPIDPRVFEIYYQYEPCASDVVVDSTAFQFPFHHRHRDSHS